MSDETANKWLAQTASTYPIKSCGRLDMATYMPEEVQVGRVVSDRVRYVYFEDGSEVICVGKLCDHVAFRAADYQRLLADHVAKLEAERDKAVAEEREFVQCVIEEMLGAAGESAEWYATVHGFEERWKRARGGGVSYCITCESCGGRDTYERKEDGRCGGCGKLLCQSCVDVFGHLGNGLHGAGNPREAVESLRARVAQLEAEQRIADQIEDFCQGTEINISLSRFLSGRWIWTISSTSKIPIGMGPTTGISETSLEALQNVVATLSILRESQEASDV